MANLEAKIPQRLREEVQQYLDAGGHRDIDAMVTEALRRYLDSHSHVLVEQFIQEDIEWGLHGRD